MPLGNHRKINTSRYIKQYDLRRLFDEQFSYVVFHCGLFVVLELEVFIMCYSSQNDS